MIYFKQGISTVPWSALSLVDYDYKTGVMRCVLPKSEAATFGSNTVIWPFTIDGGKLPLIPAGPPKRQDTCSPPIYTRSLRDNAQRQQCGPLINNSTIDMVFNISLLLLLLLLLTFHNINLYIFNQLPSF